jgi:CBS domain-containing protein
MWRRITSMKVREIMSSNPICCRPTDRLADVAWKMYEGDCGVLPVLGEKGEAVGMITDRDVAIATMTRNKPPSELFVAEVMSGKVHACGSDDNLESALETMAAGRVRRLPVLDAERSVVGVLSMNDVILRLGRATTHLALTRHVLTALHRICEHSDQGGAPMASGVLGTLGRYKQTEEAVSEAALVESVRERKKNEKKKPAEKKLPRS